MKNVGKFRGGTLHGCFDWSTCCFTILIVQVGTLVASLGTRATYYYLKLTFCYFEKKYPAVIL